MLIHYLVKVDTLKM